MSQQRPCGQPYKKCIFYFKYEMRVEFIPHIEEEVIEFLSVCEERVQYQQQRAQILVVINKRVSDIDRFFQKHWGDYRIQQILRSRKLMVGFTKTHHRLLANKKHKTIQQSGQRTMPLPGQRTMPLPGQRTKQLPGQRTLQLSADKNTSQPQSQHQPHNNGVSLCRDSANEAIILPLSKEKAKDLSPNLSVSREQKKSGFLQPQSPQKMQHSISPRYSKTAGSHPKLPITPRQIHTAEKQSGNRSHREAIKGREPPHQNHHPTHHPTHHPMKGKATSGKMVPKLPSTTRKMTKEEYIAYLRGKKTS